MTRHIRKARIPAKTQQEIVFSEDDWKRIEKAYGHSLSVDIRAYICLVAEALRLVGSAEINAPSLKRMIEKTNKLRDAAQSLLQEAGLPGEAAAWSSFEDIADVTATVLTEFPVDEVQFLTMVHSLLASCQLMIKKWETDPGLREGQMWDAWVQSINETMQRHGLPSAARKDSDSDKPYPDRPSSNFVRLIDELQKHIPKELRRHTQSFDGLAQAIYRARKSNWWPQLLPPEVREKFAADLEYP